MKLPDLRYGGAPESLGRENIALPAQLASARADVAGEVSKLVTESIDRWDKEQLRQADVNTANRMLDFEGANQGKSFYNGRDLPDEIPDSVRRKTVDGKEVWRDNIPAYEVYPTLLQMEQEKVLSEEAEGIGIPGSRERWLEEKSVAANQKLSAAFIAAQKSQADQIQSLEFEDIQAAIQNRRYGMAAELIKEYSGSDVDRKKMRADLLERQEMDAYETLMVNEDVAGMNRALHGLANQDKAKSALSATKQRQYAKLMRSELKRIDANEKKEELGARAAEEVDRLRSLDLTDAEQLEQARGMAGSQDYIDETVKRLKIRQAEAKAQEADKLKVKVQDFWSEFLKAPDPSMISADLPATTQKAAYEYAERRAAGPIVTDRKSYYELSRMQRLEPQKFDNLDLMNYSAKLSEADFEKFADLQGKPAKDPKRTRAMSYGAIVDNAMLGMGLNTKYGSKTGPLGDRVRAFEIGAAYALDAFEQEKGKPATFDEQQKIVANLALEHRRETWFSHEMMGVDDIPAEHQADVPLIMDALRRQGLAVTGANVWQMYQKRRTGGGK